MNKKNKNILIIFCLLFLLAAIVTVVFFVINSHDNKQDVNNNEDKKEVAKLKIVDTNSKSRPFAVMINNHPTARLYHSGLQDAYIIYEIIVEGGMTRYLALFKDQTTPTIGSVRSARHYFLDYALENDAYYIHWGWSPQAQDDIKKYSVNNINGLYYEGTYFYRDKDLNVSLEHTGYTSIDLLNKAVDKLKYRKETNKKFLFNYSIEPADLSKIDNNLKADDVSIRYSNSIIDNYKYDSENQYYLRYVNGKAHTDYRSGKQYTFKNIITYKVANSSIPGDEKGRQTINNIGSGTGYYISNGYAVPIKWTKSSREEQTRYTYFNGKEIDVNDGNTFINIVPTYGQIDIKENEKDVVNDDGN